MITPQEKKEFLRAYYVLGLTRTEAGVYAGITPGQATHIFRTEHLPTQPRASQLANISPKEILEVAKIHTVSYIAELYGVSHNTAARHIRRAIIEGRTVPEDLQKFLDPKVPIEELEAKLLTENR